jgi:transposase-like protein
MTKLEQTRLTAWRFKVLQRAGERARNVAHTCRHFGISRKTFYKWKRRHDEHGAGGCATVRVLRIGRRALPRVRS